MRTLRATVMFAACAAFVAISTPWLPAYAEGEAPVETATSVVSDTAAAPDRSADQTVVDEVQNNDSTSSLRLPKVRIMASVQPDAQPTAMPAGTAANAPVAAKPEEVDQGLTSAVTIPDDLQLSLADVPGGKRALLCLAMNDYFEARGENLEGRVAVAKVVMNRTLDARFPSTVCGVVFDRRRVSVDGSRVCQFSWHCDGQSDTPVDGTAWRESLLIAAAVLFDGDSIDDPTGGAMWYHASSVTPPWSPQLQQVAEIGHHVFYQDAPSDHSGDQQVASLVVETPSAEAVDDVETTAVQKPTTSAQ